MDERIIVEARWKYLLLLIVAAGFVASLSLVVSAHMSWQQTVGALTVGLFFGIGALVALLGMVRRGRLHLSNESLTYVGPISHRSFTLKWADVQEFRVSRDATAVDLIPMGVVMPGYRYLPGKGPESRLRSMSRDWGGVDGAFGMMWPMSAKKLVALLEVYRLRAQG